MLLAVAEALTLPALSVQVPLADCAAPSPLSTTAASQKSIPDSPSLPEKLTVTSVLFHPFELAAGDAEALAQSAYELLTIYAWQADCEPAVRAADEVIARLADAPPVLRYPIVLMRAILLAVWGRVEEALAAYAEGEAMRCTTCSPAVDAMATAVEPHFRWILSDLPAASAASRRAVAEFDAAGLHWQAADIEWVAPFSEYMLGRQTTADALEAMARRARRVGHIGAYNTLLQHQTVVALWQGDFAAAEAVSRESIELSRATQNRWGYFSMLLGAFIAVYRRRFDDARRLAAEALAWEPDTYWTRVGRWSEFFVLAQFAPDEAAARWAPAEVRFPEPGRPTPLGAWSNLSTVVMGLGALGRYEEAGRYADLAERMIDAGIIWPLWFMSAYTTAGVAAGGAADWDRAERHFRRALEYADENDVGHERPTVRYWYGDLLARLTAHITPGGVVFFSTNFRRFKLDEAALGDYFVRDITRQTIPEDFRNQRIHQSWKLVRRE